MAAPEARSRQRRWRARPSVRALTGSSSVERLAQVLLAVLLVAGLVWMLRLVGVVFGPVLISLLLAYVLNNLIDWIASRGLGRTLAVVVIAGSAFLGMAAFLFLALPIFISEMSQAFADLPQQAREALDRSQSFLVERVGLDPVQVEEMVDRVTVQARETLVAAGSGLVQSAASLLNAVLIPVFTFYFLRDWNRLVRLPLLVIPERFHDGVVARARVMDRAAGGWVRGQIKVALVLSVLYAIGLSIVGVKLGVVIGILAGLLNIIPYLGGAIGIGLAVVMVLVEQGGLPGLVAVAVVFAVVQLLESYVITPRLVGEEVGLSPVMVLIVLLVGGTAFGFVGMVLAIPATAAGAVIAHDLLEVYRRTDFWAGRSQDSNLEDVLRAPPKAGETPQAEVSSGEQPQPEASSGEQPTAEESSPDSETADDDA